MTANDDTTRQNGAARKFTVLGSGTSIGTPVVGCACEICRSEDPRDKRLRPSLLVESPTTRVVIDTSADFRQQMLLHDILTIDGVVFTHHHIDHIGGFDDVRGFNFMMRRSLPIYLMQETFDNLKRTFLYAFENTGQKGGGVPVVDPVIIEDKPFSIGDLEFLPIPMWHGAMRVNGYRIGNFAYCTDTNNIPHASLRLLEGVDTLILDALHYAEHPTHFTVDEAVSVAKRIGARQTYFIHMSHRVRHAELEAKLPPGIFLSYDGLAITL